jgi:hypothetical protein
VFCFFDSFRSKQPFTAASQPRTFEPPLPPPPHTCSRSHKLVSIWSLRYALFFALCLWLMCGFDQVGGFSHGKSYATDVAEIIARSQASLHPAQQRGLPLPPADGRRAAAPVDVAPGGTWAHDEQFAGVDAHADHLRQYSPLPSFQHNDNFLNHAISPTFLQGNLSSRSHSQLHAGGSEHDVGASAEQRPQKKAWELEVERLRLTMQQQHLAGLFLLVLASSSFTIPQQDQTLYPRL